MMRWIAVLIACCTAACVEQPGASSRARNETRRLDSGAQSPAAVGTRDAELPQHPVLRLTPPRPITTAAPLDSPVALASLPEGGAIVVWRNVRSSDEGPISS